MLDLTRIDFNDLDDIKKIKKLKKSELLKFFKNPKTVESLSKNELLEILLENEFHLIFKDQLTKLHFENMNLKTGGNHGGNHGGRSTKYRKEVEQLNSKIEYLEGLLYFYRTSYEMSERSKGGSVSSFDFKPYYKQLAKYLHPDRMGGNCEAMQILNELKEKLK